MKYTFELNANGTVKSATWRKNPDDNYCYGTNGRGEGIFQYYDNGDMKQLAGTCQFSIAGLTKGAARAKIRK